MHIISISDLDIDIINKIFARAKDFESGTYNGVDLSGKVCCNLFLEDSTRTRISFEKAFYSLGGQVINFNSSGSSVSKGETAEDTIRTVLAMQPDYLVIRANSPACLDIAVEHSSCPVINAGDGKRSHPSQALLDVYTIIQAGKNVQGLRVAICGDILHSRVACSDIELLSMMGANIILVAPEAFIPDHYKGKYECCYESIEKGIKSADVVMMLRTQKERLGQEIQSEDMYSLVKRFQLTSDKLYHANNDVIVMHPGPVNRDVEIASNLIYDHQYSVIERQVTNGVLIRKALFDIVT